MSVRNWLFAITLGLAAIGISGWAVFQTGYLLGIDAGEYQANSDTYAHHAEQEIRSTCAGLDGVAQTECISRVVESANQHERAEGDLVAQRNMARWALWMLIVTGLMAFVTAIGVYYVWRTLLATQDMAGDTREIGQTQIRAWLSFNIERIDFFQDELEDGPRLEVAMTYANHGAQPATYVAATVGIFDPDLSFEERHRRFELMLREHHASRVTDKVATVFPGEERDVKLSQLFPIDFEPKAISKTRRQIAFVVGFAYARNIEGSDNIATTMIDGTFTWTDDSGLSDAKIVASRFSAT